MAKKPNRLIIYSPNGPISDRAHSHRASWPRMRAHQIESTTGRQVDLANTPEDLDALIDLGPKPSLALYLGMEWNGALNFFGGVNAKAFDRLIAPAIRFKDVSDIWYLDEMLVTPLMDLFHLRSDAEKWDPGFKYKRLAKAYESCAKPLVQPVLPRMIFGDSHSVAQYPMSSATVMRNDGLTLHGALGSGFINKIVESWPGGTTNVGAAIALAACSEMIVSLGNIDIRHHALRVHGSVDKAAASPDFNDRLIDELFKLKKMLGKTAKIKLVAPLPIETEERRIPQTGWYKGKPFYGLRADRAALAKSILVRWKKAAARIKFLEVIEYPDEFFEDRGKYFMTTDVMEKPGSVHISWEHSRFSRRQM